MQDCYLLMYLIVENVVVLVQMKMLTKLRSEGVTCLKPEYIAEYLMHQDPPPLINQFIVQDT